MPFARPRTTRRTRFLRLASLLLAGAALFDTQGAAWARDAEGEIAGELRRGAPGDLAAELRGGEASSPPFHSAPRDLSPFDPPFLRSSGPIDPKPADEAEPEVEDEHEESKPSRPHFDLFEDAPAGRARRVGRASEPRAPRAFAGDRRDDAGARPGAGAQGTDNTRSAPGLRGDGDTALSDGELRARPANERLVLPAAPAGSLRARIVGDRVGRGAPTLRGAVSATGDDPFAPLGLRLGSSVLYAALDQSLGMSDNLERTPAGKGGAFSDTTLSARLGSDWSRHAAELGMIANYRRNFSGEIDAEPDISLDGRLRLDIDRLTTANLRGGLVFRRESGEDLDAPLASDEDRPTLLNYSAAADIERQFGEAFARGTVSAVRQTTDRAGRSDIPDEDYDTFVGALRAGYRLSPILAPFVEGSLGRRFFDQEEDRLGLDRGSTVAALRGGMSFDLGEKLNGEVAVGNAWNLPDADALVSVSRPTLDAHIAWSPRRGTDIAVTAATSFEPDTVGSGTSTLYQGGLAARHRATARLDVNAGTSLGYRDGQTTADTERTWGASAGFTYWLNRSLAVIGLASHDDVDRLHAPGDYAVNTVKLGLRLQN